MNYNRIYYELIDKARNRKIDDLEYYESHHIIPKCMKGSNKPENLVNLTAREHFIAHWLLHKNNPKNFSLLAAWNSFNRDNRGLRIKSHLYEYCRIKWIKELKGRKITHPDWWKNWTKSSVGTKWMNKNSKNFRAKQNEIEKLLDEGWVFGRITFERKPHSESHKEKIRNKVQERINDGWISPLKGRPQKKNVICPHCNKIGGGSQMARWHFNNCKVLVNQKT